MSDIYVVDEVGSEDVPSMLIEAETLHQARLTLLETRFDIRRATALEVRDVMSQQNHIVLRQTVKPKKIDLPLEGKK